MQLCYISYTTHNPNPLEPKLLSKWKMILYVFFRSRAVWIRIKLLQHLQAVLWENCVLERYLSSNLKFLILSSWWSNKCLSHSQVNRIWPDRPFKLQLRHSIMFIFRNVYIKCFFFYKFFCDSCCCTRSEMSVGRQLVRRNPFTFRPKTIFATAKSEPAIVRSMG